MGISPVHNCLCTVIRLYKDPKEKANKATVQLPQDYVTYKTGTRICSDVPIVYLHTEFLRQKDGKSKITKISTSQFSQL